MTAIFEYRGVLLEGALVTVLLAVFSLLLSVLFGLIGATLKLSESKGFNKIGTAYTTFVRGVPDLVLMMLLFYGGQQLVNDLGAWTGLWDYVEISQFLAGVLTIGFIFGAYMAETFRGAILSIPKGQIEAALSVGMTPLMVFTRVTWHQMVRYALPGFTNNWLVLVKSTALVSVIGLHDLVWNAFSAGRSVKQMFTFMLVVMVIYLLITAISDIGLRWLERKYSAGVRRD